jgi:hypothetical protein
MEPRGYYASKRLLRDVTGGDRRYGIGHPHPVELTFELLTQAKRENDFL